ncbi:uncharacterized protein [Triticum aestivum]|uniref:uncharacterized protein n=1 Tax=Triticum aestivum TaxID=4565 RepID=UPI001D02582C|nr:uncharacterized protein LOC123050396 [Triticum aestivum]
MELVGLVPTPSSGRRGTSSSPSSASSSAYGPGRSTHAAAVLRLRPAADTGARTLPLLTRATVPSRTHSLAQLPQAMAWLPASHAFAGSAMVRLASPFRLAAAGARLLPLRRRRSGFSRHRHQVNTRCTPAEAEAAGVTRKKEPAPISKKYLVAALVLVKVTGRIGAYICQKFNLQLPMPEDWIGVATTVLLFGKSAYKIVKDAKDVAELVMYIIKLFTDDSTGPQPATSDKPSTGDEAIPATSEESK